MIQQQRVMTIPAIMSVRHRAPAAAAAVNPYAAYFDHLWIAKGAASLAASYTDVVGTQTLTAPVAPTLGANGWVYTGTEYLDTGIGVTASYSVMVRCVTWSGFGSNPYGAQVAVNGHAYRIQCQQAGGSILWINQSSTSESTGTVSDTVFTQAGLTPYRGTTAKTALTGITGTTRTLLVGANNGSSVGQFFSGTIAAIGMKASTWDATAQAAAYALLAAL